MSKADLLFCAGVIVLAWPMLIAARYCRDRASTGPLWWSFVSGVADGALLIAIAGFAIVVITAVLGVR